MDHLSTIEPASNWTSHSNAPDLSFPSDSDAVADVMCVVLPFGILFSVYACFALHQTKINSSLSKMLLYNQNILDAIYCAIILSLVATNNYTLAGLNSPFVCYLLQSGFLPRMGRTMIACNVLCQSADRFWAVVYPGTYKLFAKRYIILCGTFISVYSALISLSRVFKVIWLDGNCWTNQILISEEAMFSLELLFRYVLPVSVILALNIVVLHKLRCSGLFIQNSTPVPSDSEDNVSRRTDTPSSVGWIVQRNIFCSTVILMTELTVTEIIATVLTILDLNNLVDFGVHSLSRVYYYAILSGGGGGVGGGAGGVVVVGVSDDGNGVFGDGRGCGDGRFDDRDGAAVGACGDGGCCGDMLRTHDHLSDYMVTKST
ncbi:unnamed protein product [Echinostoma caproni]|uniref:G_PROTEIN_RECEP_F1_2 domain-containing protein n=1 Tax=Echinostoma caproni TaxID=27848 RepID=A0A183AS05_9TREM|nr:unnamed protein product [Echinostoma caproni]